jgi:hypothetical protein
MRGVSGEWQLLDRGRGAPTAVRSLLLEAMHSVPWVEGEGIPDTISQGGAYARLLTTPPGEAMQR